MRVGELQKLLSSLADVLADHAGAAAADVRAFGKGLAPFKESDLTDFLTLVRDANEARKAAPAGRAAAKEKAPGKPKKLPAEEVATQVRAVYDRGGSPDVTPEEIANALAGLDGLTKDGLLVVLRRLGVAQAPAGLKVGQLADLIRKKVHDNRGMPMRAAL